MELGEGVEPPATLSVLCSSNFQGWYCSPCSGVLQKYN